MTNAIEVNDETTRTYATKANLIKGIEKYGLAEFEDLRYVIVRTESGRWTAVFLISAYLAKHGGYAGIASQFGFLSV